MIEYTAFFSCIVLAIIDSYLFPITSVSKMCKILLHFFKMCKEFLHFLTIKHFVCLVFIHSFIKNTLENDLIRCPLLVFYYIDLIHPERKNG